MLQVRISLVLLLEVGVALSLGCGNSGSNGDDAGTGGADGSSGSCADGDPCQNGGLCIDVGGQAVCDCASSGFTGNTCETDVNECDSAVSPCDDFGARACMNTNGGFECVCNSGYTGLACDLCDENFADNPMNPGECIVDPCAADPCGIAVGTAASCAAAGPGAFTCTCESNYDPDDNCASCRDPFAGTMCLCDSSAVEARCCTTDQECEDGASCTVDLCLQGSCDRQIDLDECLPLATNCLRADCDPPQSTRPTGCVTTPIRQNEMCIEGGTLGFCINGDCI